MRHIQYITAESRRADNIERETQALARVAFMKMATDCLRDAQPNETTIDEWKDIDFELRISYAADKTSAKTWDDIENEFDEQMVDSSTGLPIPPKSSKGLDSWPDGSMKRLRTAAEFKELAMSLEYTCSHAITLPIRYIRCPLLEAPLDRSR